MDNKGEPPSCGPRRHLFLIGKDSHGHWVAQDQNGLRGGLFVDRNQGLKFALFENGHQPDSIVMVPGVIELDMTRRTATRHPSIDTIAASPGRRAA